MTEEAAGEESRGEPAWPSLPRRSSAMCGNKGFEAPAQPLNKMSP